MKFLFCLIVIVFGSLNPTGTFSQVLAIRGGMCLDIYQPAKTNNKYNQQLEFYMHLKSLELNYIHFNKNKSLGFSMTFGWDRPGFGMNITQYPDLQTSSPIGFSGRLPQSSPHLSLSSILPLYKNNELDNVFIRFGFNSRYQSHQHPVYSMASYHWGDNYYQVRVRNEYLRSFSLGIHTAVLVLVPLGEHLSFQMDFGFSIGLLNWREQTYEYAFYNNNTLIDAGTNYLNYKGTNLNVLLGIAYLFGG